MDDDDDQPEFRPLPDPPRCRGIQLVDGNYNGCAYGYGDLEPFTGPCHCPVCKGSGIEGIVGTFLPHADFGAADCCGCLTAVIRGDQADIVCNECGAVVRTVPVGAVQHVLTEMELTLDLCTEMCPYCGKVSVFSGYSRMDVYTCPECGKAVSHSDDPASGGGFEQD